MLRQQDVTRSTEVWGVLRAQSDNGIVCSCPVHCSRFNLTLSSKAISLTFFFLNIPHAHPSSFNSPHYLRLQSSLLLARVTAVLSHREREKGQQRGDGGRKEKEVQARRGRDEFHRRATRLYAFLKGCASCSFSSPPPLKLTHHTARTHASHTLKHALLLLLPQWCPLFLQHAPYRTGSGDFFAFFFLFFLPIHYCFPLACSFLRAPVFSL